MSGSKTPHNKVTLMNNWGGGGLTCDEKDLPFAVYVIYIQLLCAFYPRALLEKNLPIFFFFLETHIRMPVKGNTFSTNVSSAFHFKQVVALVFFTAFWPQQTSFFEIHYKSIWKCLTEGYWQEGGRPGLGFCRLCYTVAVVQLKCEIHVTSKHYWNNIQSTEMWNTYN